MAERGIMMMEESVRAIEAGRKTMTRRLMNPQPPAGYDFAEYCINPPLKPATRTYFAARFENHTPPLGMWTKNCPHAMEGDRLWVRETWAPIIDYGDGIDFVRKGYDPKKHKIVYKSDEGWTKDDGPWRSPLLMPKAFSRITLEVTRIRVERVNAISREDALAEGIEVPMTMPATINGQPGDVTIFDPVKAYAMVWDAMHGKDQSHRFAAGPWCWVLTFKVVKAHPLSPVMEKLAEH